MFLRFFSSQPQNVLKMFLKTFFLYWSGTCKNDTIAVYYIMKSLQRISQFSHERTFIQQQRCQRSRILWFLLDLQKKFATTGSCRSESSRVCGRRCTNHNTDVDFEMLILFLFKLLINTFLGGILGVEAGQCSMLFLILTQISASTFL